MLGCSGRLTKKDSFDRLSVAKAQQSYALLNEHGELGKMFLCDLLFYYLSVSRLHRMSIPIDSQFHILKADQVAAILRQLSSPFLIPMHYRRDIYQNFPP